MEEEQEISKKYYTLSSDIYKILQLNKEHREGNSKDILNEYYNQYVLGESKLCLEFRVY